MADMDVHFDDESEELSDRSHAKAAHRGTGTMVRTATKAAALGDVLRYAHLAAENTGACRVLVKDGKPLSPEGAELLARATVKASK